MEASDGAMDLFDDFSSLPTMQNRNDPWIPTKDNPTAIPKLLDPLRNMISSEIYLKSLGTKISYSCTTVFVQFGL